MVGFYFLISFYFLPVVFTQTDSFRTKDAKIICPNYKNGPNIELRDLVGTWLTMYTQPGDINCFTLRVRSTTDLERENQMLKFGNFSGNVNWSECLLEVETTQGKHYLMGDGTMSGILENIIILEDGQGSFYMQDQNADQWTMFGRRGSELLLMRDCTGGAVAVFARAPYWPTATDLYAILHRSGIAPLTSQRVLCEPLNMPSAQCLMQKHFSTGKT